jgi:hypothetical protein
VIAVGVRQHEVTGVDVVELVDLVLSVEDRHVPFEQIDENRFAGRKHGAHYCCVRLAAGREDVQHVGAPGPLWSGARSRQTGCSGYAGKGV